jgi:hypothetical protein
MERLYPIIVNVLVGSLMVLVGFKIYVPRFKSDEAKENFYKNYSLFFKIGGILMLAWGLYQRFR